MKYYAIFTYDRYKYDMYNYDIKHNVESFYIIIKYRNFPLAKILASQVKKLAHHVRCWHVKLKHWHAVRQLGP